MDHTGTSYILPHLIRVTLLDNYHHFKVKTLSLSVFSKLPSSHR